MANLLFPFRKKSPLILIAGHTEFAAGPDEAVEAVDPVFFQLCPIQHNRGV
jgi:hypothetical protein